MSNFCSKCGAVQNGKSNFCAECGNPIAQRQELDTNTLPIHDFTPTSANDNNYNNYSYGQNRYHIYKESGKVEWIRFAILSLLGIFIVILVGYGYSFLIDKYTTAVSELKHGTGRGGIIIMGLILLAPVVGLLIPFVLISSFGASRNKKLNFLVFTLLAVISWYYSTAFSLQYRYNIADGFDFFPDLNLFPYVGPAEVLEYAFTLGWFTSILHIIELGIFILIAYVAKEMSSYYCEKCSKKMSERSFYTISALSPDEYVKSCHKSKAGFLAQTAYDKENILAMQDFENKYIYYCNVHTCDGCSDTIIDIKRSEIDNSGNKLKLEDKEDAIKGMYL
jgi:hypothetical protein